MTGNIGQNKACRCHRLADCEARRQRQPLSNVAERSVDHRGRRQLVGDAAAPRSRRRPRRNQRDLLGRRRAAPNQVILTGNGGNPFTESGWTGWTALDNGMRTHQRGRAESFGVTGPSLTMSPCFQTGVLGAFNGTEKWGPTGSGDRFLQHVNRSRRTMQTERLRPSTSSPTSSNDNRAYSPVDGRQQHDRWRW